MITLDALMEEFFRWLIETCEGFSISQRQLEQFGLDGVHFAQDPTGTVHGCNDMEADFFYGLSDEEKQRLADSYNQWNSMKVVINADNIEMHPETPHERQALERLRAARDADRSCHPMGLRGQPERTVFLIPKDDWGT